MRKEKQEDFWNNLSFSKDCNNAASLGFEEKLWQAANKFRHNVDAGEYKHIVLGLIFLKYISDTHRQNLQKKHLQASNKYFTIPPKACWEYLRTNSENSKIGKLIDNAMDLIERSNPDLKHILPRNYSGSHLDRNKLGELVDLISSIGLECEESESKDILGRVYEYFLGKFAEAEGNRGGQFYTPRCVVKLLVEMIQPFQGKIFDPCCGSGGMFVQSKKFIAAHKGRLRDISVFGQESNQTTWRLCKMNLARLGLRSSIQWNNEGSFLNDAHHGLKADFIITNPPFNDSDWGQTKLLNDSRWKFGVPSQSNANFAWVQHFLSHLSENGVAGFVLANGSLSSNASNEGEIRKNIIEADLIDCVVGLPDKLFYNTQISACLWFMRMNRKRKGETLFINARDLGSLSSKRHRDLADDEINKIVRTYHSWRDGSGDYKNQQGFCNVASIFDIKKHKYALVPGRYAGPYPQPSETLTNRELMNLKLIVNKRLERIKEAENLYSEFFERVL
jgi:type I restriction enzyme M protein